MQKSGGAVIPMKNSEITYLFGKEEVSAIPPPRITYEDQCIEFLDCLSKAIRSDGEAKRYPELLTFAFWIRRAGISKLGEAYAKRQGGIKRIGKGLVFHIAPSNVPVNFAYTLVFGMLAGNANVVKVSSKRFRQVDILCRLMSHLTEQEEFQWVERQNAVVMYDRSGDATDYFSGICDARVIWGGDATIAQVRKSPLQPRSTEVTFADRYSFAILSAEAINRASEEEIKQLARRFYNDTYLMDQNACSSPHLVCWMGKEDGCETAGRRFWREVFAVCAESYELADVKVSEKYALLCKIEDEFEDIKVTRYKNALYVVRLELLPNEITELRGKFGLFFECRLDSLEEIIERAGKKVQTCAVYGIETSEIADCVCSMHAKGIDRIVPIGGTLDIGVFWDGYDVISELSRCIIFE